LEATTATQEAPEQEGEQAPEQEEESSAEQEKEERQLNILLRKAESAFVKGNKGLFLSRVECGKWFHAIYVLRASQGHKDSPPESPWP